MLLIRIQIGRIDNVVVDINGEVFSFGMGGMCGMCVIIHACHMCIHTCHMFIDRWGIVYIVIDMMCDVVVRGIGVGLFTFQSFLTSGF